MNNGGKISLKYLSTLILTLLFFCITVNSSARYYRNRDQAPAFYPGYHSEEKHFSIKRHCHHRFGAAGYPSFSFRQRQAAGAIRFMPLIPKIRWMHPFPTVPRTLWCWMCPPKILHYIIRPIQNTRTSTWMPTISGWIRPTACCWLLIREILQAQWSGGQK